MAVKPVAKIETKAAKAEVKTDVFYWEGTDRKGNRIKGESRASSPAIVKAELRKQGVLPLKVRKKMKSLLGAAPKKITSSDIATFSRQLATMMAAGVPLVQAFDIVGRGHENRSMQELILTIKNDVESGTALHQCLRKHPLYFDDLFCNLVEAGEQAGVLEKLLDKIATYKEKTESMKKKIKKALTYPAAVVVVAVVVTAVIMIFVIPQFKSLFSSFGSELPAFTLMLVAISDFMVDWWWAMLFGGVGAGLAMAETWKRSRQFRESVDIVMLKLPIIGLIMHKSAVARFARTLSVMFNAGVPLVEALESVAGATGNIVYGKAVLKMRDDVATGQSLQLSMKQQNLFPHMVIQMTAIGEESGSLDAMLAKVAAVYEEDVDNMVDSLSSLLEPMIMGILGGLVGALLVGMYLPIFKMAAVM